MERKNPNNRSLLALAGQSSMANHSVTESSVRQFAPPRHQPYYNPPPLNQSLKLSAPKPFNLKQTVKKLGFARLRKMQALVRGFIIRRKVYPVQLANYLIAQSLLDIIVANVMYRQCSSLIVETVTLGRYDQDQAGEGRIIQEYLYNVIVRRVIEKEFEPIAKDAIYQTAVYASRPTFTFGFNLRDPMEYLLFNKTNSMMTEIFEEIAEEAIKEEVQNRRQLQIIDKIIGNMGLLEEMCQQVVEQCLMEGIEHYVVENMFEKIVQEGAQLVAQKVYSDQVASLEDTFIQDFSVQAQEWILQQAILQAMVQPSESHPIQPSKGSHVS